MNKTVKGTTQISKQDGEYRVRLFIDGIYQAGGDYFTDDKEDAENTAKSMRKKPVPTDKTDENAIREQQEYDQNIKEITIKINCDFMELAKQKGWLEKHERESDEAQGLLYLLDHIQDSAVEQGATTKEIFGFKS